MNNTANNNIDPSAPPAIRVRVEKGEAEKTDFCFREPFRIGREKGCDIQLFDSTVSRYHAEVLFVGGSWWVNDLQSANGTYTDGKRVERSQLQKENRIQLGVNGPILSLELEGAPKAEKTDMADHSVTHYMQRYFTNSSYKEVGKHTMMIRRAFEKVQKKQKRKFAGIVGVVVCLFLAASTYAFFKHMELRKQKVLAQEIFYTMKSLELEFAHFLKTARDKKDALSKEHVKTYRSKRKRMEETYNEFIDSLKVYEENISEEKQAILRIARTLGECEIAMPAGFVGEVLNYIKKWKSTQRLEKSLLRARKNGYPLKIAENLLAHDLPPLFFYLALQESGFDVNACGPKTKYGIAKGMWQFIPSTARYYGLRTGPRVRLRRADPHDERHNFEKSTQAAARYLRDIYDTDAQASGLLVMASYNWGERRVNELIQKMPENPRERNFWRLLVNHRKEIPQETYDYVFYIIAAAVIGENPGLFGFDFNNPFDDIEVKLSS